MLVIDEVFVLVRPRKELLLDLVVDVPRASEHAIEIIIKKRLLFGRRREKGSGSVKGGFFVYICYFSIK